MANFAKLDDNNVVLEVNVVANEILDPLNEEESGIAFLTEWSGGHSNWKQASITARIRKNIPAAGYIYDPVRDAFIPPTPSPFQDSDGTQFEWRLDEETCNWEMYPVE
jgi:hypothetical protein